MKKRLVLILLGALVGAAALTACGPTFEQRLEQRDQCEAAGGTYNEWRDGWGTGYITDCSLERDDS